MQRPCRLLVYGMILLDFRPLGAELRPLLDGQTEQVDEACGIGLVVILVHAEGSGLLVVQGVGAGDAGGDGGTGHGLPGGARNGALF